MLKSWITDYLQLAEKTGLDLTRQLFRGEPEMPLQE